MRRCLAFARIALALLLAGRRGRPAAADRRCRAHRAAPPGPRRASRRRPSRPPTAWPARAARSPTPRAPACCRSGRHQQRPEAEIFYVAYTLDDADARAPARDLPVQRRPRGGERVPPSRRHRAAPARGQCRRHLAAGAGRPDRQPADLARLHRPRVRRSGRHRLQPGAGDRRTARSRSEKDKASATTGASRAISTASASSSGSI